MDDATVNGNNMLVAKTRSKIVNIFHLQSLSPISVTNINVAIILFYLVLLLCLRRFAIHDFHAVLNHHQ